MFDWTEIHVVPTLAERFEVWERKPPADLFGDPIWRLPAFRIALFISAVGRDDAAQLRTQADTRSLADQLVRAADSIGANIAEGYSRLRGKERARYYEIALGSAREAREWYRGARAVLGEAQAAERAALLTRAIKILTVAIPAERKGASEKRIAASRRRQQSD